MAVVRSRGGNQAAERAEGAENTTIPATPFRMALMWQILKSIRIFFRQNIFHPKDYHGFMTYQVNALVLIGKHLSATPTNIMELVKIIAFRSPLVSKIHKTGKSGMMYMIFPQLPNIAKVALLHSGQKTAKSASEIGPILFHIMP